MESLTRRFEKTVEQTLVRCFEEAHLTFLPSVYLGVAVSGGADSVSLLLALKELSPCRLEVVTVNHGLRGNEGAHDTLFVEELCASLGVGCTRYDIPEGRIHELARDSFLSLEAAARKERYRIFEDFITQKELSLLCLAHNKDDQLETVLMRFVQGSFALWGIPLVRGKYARPLLNTSRKEIEAYLQEKHAPFCTDSTNADPSFLRNKIRSCLVPFLDESFASWRGGLLTLSNKALTDENFIQDHLQECLKLIDYKADEECVSFRKDPFFALHQALRMRVVMRALDYLKPQKRISHSFLAQAFATCHKNGSSFYASNIVVLFQKGRVIIRKTDKSDP